MISIAVEHRDAFELFFTNYEHDPNDKAMAILDDILTDDDWKILDKINETLSVLQRTSMVMESSFASLYNVIPSMDSILDHFEKLRLDTTNQHMMPMYQNGWEKMTKYYKDTSNSTAYIAAIVLHPEYKWDYIEHTWEKDWLDEAKVFSIDSTENTS